MGGAVACITNSNEPNLLTNACNVPSIQRMAQPWLQLISYCSDENCNTARYASALFSVLSPMRFAYRHLQPAPAHCSV